MTSREFLFMDTYPEPPDANEETGSGPQGCPNDTDGDGNCGGPACPYCGKYRLHIDYPSLTIEPKSDTSETPVPKRNVDTY